MWEIIWQGHITLTQEMLLRGHLHQELEGTNVDAGTHHLGSPRQVAMFLVT